jgi:hypothetical protein
MSIQCRQNYPISLKGNALVSLREPTVVDDTVVYIMPNPFQLLGLGVPLTIGGDVSAIYPVWEMSSSADQLTYQRILIWPLFVSMMYANRESGGGDVAPFVGVTYEEMREFGRFNGYFMNYLSNQLKPNNFNTFNEPPLEILKYWNNLVISNPDGDGWLNPELSMKQLVHLMYRDSSDKRMWGTPGKYIIDLISDAIAFDIVVTQDDQDCPHTTFIEIPAEPTEPWVFGNTYLEVVIDFVGDIPFPQPPPTTVVTPPDNLSVAAIMAWIDATLQAAPYGYDPANYTLAIDGVDPQKIVFTTGATIDGCIVPFLTEDPGVTAAIFPVITLTTTNPFLQSFKDYFDANGFYPKLVTAEFQDTSIK